MILCTFWELLMEAKSLHPPFMWSQGIMALLEAHLEVPWVPDSLTQGNLEVASC